MSHVDMELKGLSRAKSCKKIQIEHGMLCYNQGEKNLQEYAGFKTLDRELEKLGMLNLILHQNS